MFRFQESGERVEKKSRAGEACKNENFHILLLIIFVIYSIHHPLTTLYVLTFTPIERSSLTPSTSPSAHSSLSLSSRIGSFGRSIIRYAVYIKNDKSLFPMTKFVRLLHASVSIDDLDVSKKKKCQPLGAFLRTLNAQAQKTDASSATAGNCSEARALAPFCGVS